MQDADRMGISVWDKEYRTRRYPRSSDCRRLRVQPILILLMLGVIGSVMVSGESFVSDPSNEDTVIVPQEEMEGDEDGGSCDGGRESERIFPAHGHDADDSDESDGKFVKWDEHFAKDRSKHKSGKGLRSSPSSSSLVPHSRRSRFGFRDRSFSPSSLFRWRTRHTDFTDDHKDHGEDFASEDEDASASEGTDAEDDSVMESSDPTPFRSSSRNRHSSHRSHPRPRHQHHDNDFHDFHDSQHMRDYPEDAAIEELLTSSRNRGRHRNRSSFFRPTADHRDVDRSGGRRRGWRLFGR